MRTRRSWRNQDRLFRALFQPPPSPAVAPPPIRTDAEIDAIPGLSKTSRSLMKRDAARARARKAVQR